MKFVIFGLTLSSAWANGHATQWRGLLKALHRQGHAATFFERDVDYYRAHRDLAVPDFCDLTMYSDWATLRSRAQAAVDSADVAMVTSYCPDGLRACRLVLNASRPLRVFYDLDTPVTLSALAEHGLAVPSGAHYLTPDLIPEFDLYLSFTGGPLLDVLKQYWGARRTASLYGSVDPDVHVRVADPAAEFRCSLGYLGTYAPDRQIALERLLIEPALRRPVERFLVAGSLYPPSVAWPPNVATRWHLEPELHSAFYSGSRLTLSITRRAMLEWGYTPSVRLFEAAACGTPVVSDPFPGVDDFFDPDAEILLAHTAEEVESALSRDDAELRRIGNAARERTLVQHTCERRAIELIQLCEASTC